MQTLIKLTLIPPLSNKTKGWLLLRLAKYQFHFYGLSGLFSVCLSGHGEREGREGYPCPDAGYTPPLPVQDRVPSLPSSRPGQGTLPPPSQDKVPLPPPPLLPPPLPPPPPPIHSCVAWAVCLLRSRRRTFLSRQEVTKQNAREMWKVIKCCNFCFVSVNGVDTQ